MKTYVEKMNKELQIKLSQWRNGQINNPTKSELVFKSKLERMNFRFLFQKGFIRKNDNSFYVCDFYLPNLKLVIEVDGSAHKFRAAKDSKKNEYLTKERKFAVLRISNQEAFNLTDDGILKLMKFTERGKTIYSQKYFRNVRDILPKIRI